MKVARHCQSSLEHKRRSNYAGVLMGHASVLPMLDLHAGHNWMVNLCFDWLPAEEKRRVDHVGRLGTGGCLWEAQTTVQQSEMNRDVRVLNA